MQVAKRLEQIGAYLFADLDRKQAELTAKGVDVISLSVGDPDLPTPAHIVDAVMEGASDARTHRYPPYAGTKEFRHAAAGWFARRFGVTLDPETEVLALIGSKEGLAHLPWAILNPGDVALIPDPGYPVYRSSTILAEGVPHAFPLIRERGFLPDPLSHSDNAKKVTSSMARSNSKTALPGRRRRTAFRRLLLATALALFLGDHTGPQAVTVPGGTCADTSNPVVCENRQTEGVVARSVWDVTGPGDPELQGFATDISVPRGGTVHFKITSTTDYRIRIYRLGYYGGNGARRLATLPAEVPPPGPQPVLPADVQAPCIAPSDGSGLIDCGNWGPAPAPSLAAAKGSGGA